ncbi:uncharacterized protein (TIGR02099 family) [Thiogranum longum]|uniref:Uncharacterized protein (TIGR02099 family) n=1 Tax=Thiogranum longum TaxID=1537524 RepID=A0A4R1H6Z6_9GAMM|nr:YhdP family protein [Thiogranum longum]TCK17544.1 uncharacterized protein (TIGR02099 family) [Thiogranum longum]
MPLRRLGRMLWWVAASVIVGLAVALSAARLLLPGMAEYRGQVETLVEEVLDRPVEIGSMNAAWHRLSPVLRLQQVVVHDDRFPGGRLDIGEVQVGLNIVDSLLRQKWLTSGIRIIGVQLALQTDLSAEQDKNASLDAFYWLMHQESVSLEQITLDWQDPGLFAQPVHLTDLSAQLKSDGWRHQLLVQTDINEAYGKRIELAADLSGPLKWPQDWTGQLYLKTEDFHVSSVAEWIKPLGYIAKGDVDFEVWANIRNRKLLWSAGSIDVAHPMLSRPEEPEALYTADELSSRFSLRAKKQGWTLELQKFSLMRDQVEAWPESSLRATVRNDASLSVQGRASHVVVSEVSRILPLLPWVGAEMRQRIKRIKPRGELKDTEFELYLHDNAPPDMSLRSSFDNLGMMADDRLPGATGLSGRLEGNLQAGRIDFDSEAVNLQFPRIFSEVPTISRLSGRLEWQHLTDRFRVNSDRLLLVSGPLRTWTRLQLDWVPGQAVPWIDMQLQADDVAVTDIRPYFPDKVLRPKAMKWLGSAFRRGNVHDVRFLLQGPLDHVPFDQGDGRLEVRFDFDDVLLDYHPLWGQLDALRGSALFSGRSMRITADSATILDANVDRAVASIDDFSKPVLDIDGTVSGTLESLLAYINYSPLRDRFGQLVDRTTTRGDADLQLGLRIPLHRKPVHVEVEGTVGFHGDTLKVVDSDIALEQVNGFLKFSDKGVTARDVRAKLFGHPVKVSVYPEGSADTQRTTVDIEGNLGLEGMLEKEFPRIAPYVDGAAYWHALLQIPAGRDISGRSVVLKLRSDLKGVATSLPHPFSKLADDARSLSVAWVPGQLSKEPLEVTLDEDVLLSLLLRENGGGLRKAGIHFGEGSVTLPLSDTVHIDGSLDALDLDAWIDLLRDIVKPGVEGATPAPAVSTELHIERATFLGYTAQVLNVSSLAANPWHFTVSGRDMAGQVEWTPPTGAAAPLLALRLEKLTAEKVEDSAVPESRTAPTPERLPDLDIEVGQLQVGARDFGRIVVRGQRGTEGMTFPVLEVDSRAIVFKGDGAWLQSGAQQSTRFRADITGGELGKLVKMFGDRGSIKGGEMQGHASLNWPGNPADISLTSMEGEVGLETGKGRLVEVKEGAGKLLNLFNLNSLQRRLSLDFTDLTKEGFSFDKMKGTFVIGDGNAYTEDFVIEGSSAIIIISGRTGLASRDYDQLVQVIPQVSSSLPLAGAIAGGPAVGAAVFLAERLVGKNFNRMAQVSYKVTGSWDDPVYTRLKTESDAESEPQADPSVEEKNP